jgi:hypothetical protein
MSGEQPRLRPLREPLLLRGADKALIDYRDNRMTDRMRRELQEQNEALASADFGTVLPFPSRLQRIFNGDFDHGGRFYAEGGGWQTMSKADRLRISLDGEPVVEIDYATFHPVLAYAQLGLPAPDAPYEIPGFPRELVKIAFNVLLNGSSHSGARYTIAHKPGMVDLLLDLEVAENELSTSFWCRVHQLDPTYSQRASTRAEQLIEALLVKHAEISDLFFTGTGLRLQRLDSDIAEGVMRTMRRRGILVLPVHDSFLAPASKADLLEEIMRNEAAKRGVEVLCKRSSQVPAG